MRLNIYATIAWIKAGIINGWFGTPALNPELERPNADKRRLDRQTHYQLIQRRTIDRRLRLGYVGGGRVPHRSRGAPGPPRVPATT